MIKSNEIKLVDVQSIVPNPKNANRHSIEQIKRLEKLIEYQGFRNPLVISNRSGFLIVGHGRLEAATNLGMEKLPVIYQDFDSEAQEYAYLISDNEIARWAELDKHLVYEELKVLEIEDIELLGLEDFELPDIEELDPQTDEDDVPEVETPITVRGDVWLLGKHRLMCGDSTMIDDVEKLMNGEKADMLHTDPPYGVDYDGGSKIREKLKEDHIDTDIYKDIIPIIKSTVTGACYTWYADKCADKVYSSISSIGEIHSVIIWNKNNSTFNMNIHYKAKHEPCVYWKVRGNTLMWDGGNKECTVWDIDRESSNKHHPTQKPVEIVEKIISNHSAETVLDLFGGSGSTLIACEKMSRNNFTMELDEKYCDVIINRWQNYTGKKATLEGTKQTYEDLQIERL